MFSKIPSRRKGRSPLSRLQTDSEWLENGMFVNLLLETWECGEIAEIFTSRNYKGKKSLIKYAFPRFSKYESGQSEI